MMAVSTLQSGLLHRHRSRSPCLGWDGVMVDRHNGQGLLMLLSPFRHKVEW